jgi:hypothetical protein
MCYQFISSICSGKFIDPFLSTTLFAVTSLFSVAIIRRNGRLGPNQFADRSGSNQDAISITSSSSTPKIENLCINRNGDRLAEIKSGGDTTSVVDGPIYINDGGFTLTFGPKVSVDRFNDSVPGLNGPVETYVASMDGETLARISLNKHGSMQLNVISKVDHVDSTSGLVDSLSSMGVNTVVDVVSSPQVQSASELVSTFIG